MNTDWMHNGMRYELVTKPYSEEFGQCRYCDFSDIAGDNCPRYGDNAYICDTDETKVWKEVKILKSPTQEIKDFEEPKVNPAVGRKYDSGKPRYSLLPAKALEEVVHVLTFGSQKYEDFNWMKVDNAFDRYFSAAQRHIWQWKQGELQDEETQRHHLASAVTNLLFILDMQLNETKGK